MTAHHRTPEWMRAARQARPIIAATLPAPCVDCGHPVTPDQKWQVGHIIAASAGGTDTLDNLGPSHTKSPGQRACNQIAGGRLGAARQGKTRATEQRMLPW